MNSNASVAAGAVRTGQQDTGQRWGATQRLCLTTDLDKSGFLQVFLFHNVTQNKKKR